MVGSDDHAAAGWNPPTLAIADAQGKVEITQGLLDKIKALQVRVFLGELAKSRLVEQVAEEAHQSGSDAPVLSKQRWVARFQNLVNINHYRGSPARCGPS